MALESPTDAPSSACATAANSTDAERTARAVVAAHRARLDWTLRIPEWASHFAAGVAALEFPGRRQGIGHDAALRALPVEHKQELVRWVVENLREHVASDLGQRLCRTWALERFDGRELDECLSGRQWQRLRRDWLLRLGQEHRRYKHAQTLLFIEYQPLVREIVRQIVFRPQDHADCLQEGALGLLAAIDRVDPSNEGLAGYAASWIRRGVRNHLLRQRLPVSAPVNLVSDALAGGGAARSEGTEPDAVETARRRVLLLEYLRHPAVTFDEPGADGGPPLAETLTDPACVSPAEAAAAADLREIVGGAMGVLTAKQRDVLRRRYGLGGGAAPESLSAIARRAGISHQQAGMRERRARQRMEAVLVPLAGELQGAR